MKNIILIISNKDSTFSEYFFETLVSHKNIQKVKLDTYDRIDKCFLAQKTKADYLKSPKFYCEKLDYDYQLSFRPFLKQFIFFFIIDKPKNIIKNKQDVNYYCLRLRRMYELILKTKGKNKVFFDKEVYDERTYDTCSSFLSLKNKFKIKESKNQNQSFNYNDPVTEDFYDKYRLKITKYL
jgi:hypothetical protein